MKIIPTVGRVVWYHSRPGTVELAALVAKVNEDETVNLTVSNSDGSTKGVINVGLFQDGDDAPLTEYAEWMPYQKMKAAEEA